MKTITLLCRRRALALTAAGLPCPATHAQAATPASEAGAFACRFWSVNPHDIATDGREHGACRDSHRCALPVLR